MITKWKNAKGEIHTGEVSGSGGKEEEEIISFASLAARDCDAKHPVLVVLHRRGGDR
jgi:hypothetical protein